MTADIKVMPLNGNAPSNDAIAAHLRHLADSAQEEGAAELENVVVIMEYQDGDVQRFSCGKPATRAHIIGLLAIAQATIMNEGF